VTLAGEQTVAAVRISKKAVADGGIARASPALTAVLATLPSLLLAVTLPPLWQHADSMIFLLGQITVALPHYPILYPMTSWLITGIFGYSSNAVLFMLVLQHVLLVGGLFYCLSAFPRFWHQVVFAATLFVGMRAHVYSHGIVTEAFAFGFLIVFLGAFVRIARRGDLMGRYGLRDVGIYHAALVLMCMSRISFACAALCLPFYFGVKFLLPAERNRAGIQALVCTAAGLMALVFTGMTTDVILRAVGAVDEPILGRPGVYRIQSLPWNEMSSEEKASLIRRAQANTNHEFVASIIPTLIATPNPWTGPWRAVDALRREQGATIGTDTAMSAALVAFLKTMDHRIVAAIIDDVARYFAARHQIASAIEVSAGSIGFYRTSADWPLARSIPAITGRDPDSYRAFLKNPVIRAVDAIPNYIPYGLACLALALVVVASLARMKIAKRIRVNAVIAAGALLTTGAVYVILSCVVNIVTPDALRYTVPVSGLGWAAMALLVVSYNADRPMDSWAGGQAG
jgi:hypothetical protein